MSRKYTVSVLVGRESPLYPQIREGDLVSLLPDPANPADPNAIRVEKDGVFVGYLANRADTILAGTISASNIRARFDSGRVAEMTARLVTDCSYRNAEGVPLRRFLARVYFLPVDDRKPEDAPVHGYLTLGSVLLAVTGKAKLKETVQQTGTCAVWLKRPEEEGDLATACLDPDCTEAVGFVQARDIWKEDENGQHTDDPQGLAALKQALESDVLRGTIEGDPILVRVSDRARTKCQKYALTIRLQAERPVCCEEMRQAVRNGAGQWKDIQDRVEILARNGCPENIVRRVLQNMQPERDGIHRPVRPYVSDDHTLDRFIAYALRGMAITLSGETGTGKNTLVETYAYLMNQEIVRFQGNRDADKSEFLYTRELEGGRTTVHLTDIGVGLRDGNLVVIDEANMIDPAVLTMMNSVTDEARSILIPGWGNLKVHPRTCVIYTMNQGYAGTFEVNSATLNRTNCFQLVPQVRMADLLSGVPADRVEICQNISDQIRKAVLDDHTLPASAIDIRGYIDACEVADDIPLREALCISIANKLPEQAWRDAVRLIIDMNCP